MGKIKPILAIMILAVAAAPLFLAFTVSNNPTGALSAFYLRYFAKAKPIYATLQTYAYDDTVGSAAPLVSIDTITARNREFVWLAPFDCRIDSVKVILGSGYGVDSLLDADSAVGSCYRFRVISNNSGANADTLRYDSTVSASLGSKKSALTVWKPRGGPDSTSNKVAKGKVVRFLYHTVGTTESKITFGINFLAIPADQ